MSLKIGRVGLDVSLENPKSWRFASGRDRSETIRGQLTSASLAETKALRSELLGQNGQIVAVVFSDDSTIDGFYRQIDADIDAADYSLNDTGLYDFSATLVRIGGLSSVEFQSLLTIDEMVNSHGLLDTEVKPSVAPPVGALAFDVGDTSPSAHTRVTEDGTIKVFIDLNEDIDPTWSATPASYYSGGVEITVGGRVRTGLDYPGNLPDDWMISNGQIRFTPGVTALVNNGRVQMEVWDGAGWSTPKAFKLIFEPTGTNTTVPEWHFLTIVRNDPHVGIIRLVRDAETAPAGFHTHTLDITLRRGMRHASFVYSWSGATTTWKVMRDTAEATTDITPTGAAAVVGIRATANDAGGDRFILGSPATITRDNANGGIQFATTRVFSFCIGAEINGSGAAANDLAAELFLQYFGAVYETIRAVPR